MKKVIYYVVDKRFNTIQGKFDSYIQSEHFIEDRRGYGYSDAEWEDRKKSYLIVPQIVEDSQSD